MRLVAAVTPVGILLAFYGAMLLALGTSTLLWPCVVLGVTICLQAAGGSWLGRAWALPVAFNRALWATVLLTVLGWTWQRAAFLMYVPGRELRYRYFLTPEGARAGLLVLRVPFWTVTASFFGALVVATVGTWRSRRRLLIGSLVVWWITAFLVFSMSSLYLWGQGDAGIII